MNISHTNKGHPRRPRRGRAVLTVLAVLKRPGRGRAKTLREVERIIQCGFYLFNNYYCNLGLLLVRSSKVVNMWNIMLYWVWLIINYHCIYIYILSTNRYIYIYPNSAIHNNSMKQKHPDAQIQLAQSIQTTSQVSNIGRSSWVNWVYDMIIGMIL